MLRIPSITLALILFSGCSLFGGSDSSELDKARANWARAGISDYNYKLTLSCFCGETGTFDVEVRNGVVVTTTPLAGVQFSGGDERVGKTMDDLFGVLAQAYAQNADEVLVEYIALLGYPTSISIDYEREVSDDEIFYGVDSFERLN